MIKTEMSDNDVIVKEEIRMSLFEEFAYNSKDEEDNQNEKQARQSMGIEQQQGDIKRKRDEDYGSTSIDEKNIHDAKGKKQRKVLLSSPAPVSIESVVVVGNKDLTLRRSPRLSK
jgi:hypothetical protein